MKKNNKVIFAVAGLGALAYLIYKLAKGKGLGQTFACSFCGKVFPSEAELKNHVALVHSGGKGLIGGQR